MADDTTLTPGSGVTIAADDVGSGRLVQLVKPMGGLHGVGTYIDADTTLNALAVTQRNKLVRIQVATSSGITTSVTNYTAGDQVGPQLSLASAVRATGGSGTIVGISLQDNSAHMGAMDIILSNDTMTPASDNSPVSFSDPDSLKIVEIVQLGTPVSLALNSWSRAMGLAIPFNCVATTLFANMITRTGGFFFAAATDLTITIWIIQD